MAGERQGAQMAKQVGAKGAGRQVIIRGHKEQGRSVSIRGHKGQGQVGAGR